MKLFPDIGLCIYESMNKISLLVLFLYFPTGQNNFLTSLINFPTYKWIKKNVTNAGSWMVRNGIQYNHYQLRVPNDLLDVKIGTQINVLWNLTRKHGKISKFANSVTQNQTLNTLPFRWTQVQKKVPFQIPMPFNFFLFPISENVDVEILQWRNFEKKIFLRFVMGLFSPGPEVFSRYLWNGRSTLKIEENKMHFFFDFGFNWVLTKFSEAPWGGIKVGVQRESCSK